MGVRYFCPKCNADLLGELRTVAQTGACPKCNAALSRGHARFAFVKHELQQSIYVGFLSACVTAVLAFAANNVVGGLGISLSLVVFVPAGIVFVVATFVYAIWVFRPPEGETRAVSDELVEPTQKAGARPECYLCGALLTPEERASRVCRSCRG